MNTRSKCKLMFYSTFTFCFYLLFPGYHSIVYSLIVCGCTLFFTALLFLILLLLVADIKKESIQFSTIDQDVGGKVPINIQSSRFSPSTIAEVSVRLKNSSGNLPVTAYYGHCSNVLNTTTSLLSIVYDISLPSNTLIAANYYNDTPIYVLSETVLVYNVVALTNSSSEGCVFLYLFDSFVSYQASYSQIKNFTFYYRSDCVKTMRNSSFVAAPTTILTVRVNKTTFLFSSFLTNVSSIVRFNISGKRNEYDVSLLKSEVIYKETVIQFCHHSPCLGRIEETYCILVKSSTYMSISYQNKEVDLPVSETLVKYGIEFGLIAISVIFGFVILIVLSFFIYKVVMKVSIIII